MINQCGSSCSSCSPTPLLRSWGNPLIHLPVGKIGLMSCCSQLFTIKLKTEHQFVPIVSEDPGFATFLFEQLQVPVWSEQGAHEGARCQVCATPVQQLRQQALQALQEPCPGAEMPALPASTFPGQPTRLTTHSVVTLSSRPTASRIPHQTVVAVGEQRRGLGWTSSTKPSVQVTVGGGPLTGALSSVTIQAQQYLEGMWSISRVNNFVPQPSPVC
ncbi:hypothetical protein MHYP_G00135950 [Metynnis hypsauchen]